MYKSDGLDYIYYFLKSICTGNVEEGKMSGERGRII